MTARDFLRRQFSDDERSKLRDLPTAEVLNSTFGQKQPLDVSLTTLSGKTIAAKGLDLLASSTSAAAINALGGSGGQIISAMIASIDAAKLTGTIDVARLPVIPGNNSIAATTIAGLTTLQQATVSLGTMVYTADGGAWRYSGAGSKSAEASYYYTADVTPEWNAIANKPALATAAQGAKADSALQAGASSDALSEGAANLFFAGQRVRDTVLAGFQTVASAVVSATDTVRTAIEKLQAQVFALAASKIDKSGGNFAGSVDFAVIPTFAGAKAPFTGVLGDGASLTTLTEDGNFRLTSGHPDLPEPGSANGTLAVANGSGGDVVSQFLIPIGSAKPWFRAGSGIGGASPYWSPWRRFVTSDELAGLGGGGVAGVSSFRTRTGAVSPEAGDYISNMITHGAGTVASALDGKSDNFDTLDGGAI